MSFLWLRSISGLDAALRLIRVLVGSTILLTILTAIVVPQVLPVSGNSFVNAKLEWIRTPIEGDLDFGSFKVGDQVKQGVVLGAITNNRADDFFLNQLSSEKSSLESTLFTLETRKKQLTQRSVSLSNKVTDSLVDLQEKNRIQLQLLDSELMSASQELITNKERLLRYERANEEYEGSESYAVVSRSVIDALQDRTVELQQIIVSKNSYISLLKKELESALSGTYVSENTPLEHQQLMELEQGLASITAEIESFNLRLTNVSSQIDERLVHLGKNTNFELVAGVSGILWDIGYPNGSYVNHGDSVVAIADTETVAVEGNFHQRYLDNVVVGDPATVALTGSNLRLDGTVVEVKIRDQIKSADLSAFNLEKPETNEFKVTVKLNDSDEQKVFIGQRARVIISKSSSSIIPSILLFYKR